ncbi:MAG: PD-(D/E)XK nuclease family protein [Bacteroidales bacterium]|nr:PD-(D/E)XK nuclease family protein [Bacteroidales bacterium]
MNDMNEMKFEPFLSQVARHFWDETGAGPDGTGLEELCFVLPNRRSILFLQHYFKQLAGQKPILSPEMITINDFLYRLAGEYPTDRVRLLLTLYDCYKELRKEAAEPLDEFIFWGDVLLGDFSDVDKYYCDPKVVFTNVNDFKSIDAGLDSLNEQQQEALRRFLNYFNPESEKAKKTGEHDARRPFQQIWNILYPLYTRFNAVLDNTGASYEGRVYRKARERMADSAVSAVDVLQELFPRAKKFVFTGLTKLSECEHFILQQISKRPGLAAFCWDYPGDWIANKYNKASFLQQNISDFPQAFTFQKVDSRPHINILPVASGVGQTRQIPAILKECGPQLSLESCAIILPDEGLLMSVLNAIPTQIDSINVTMGYSMSQSEFHSFLLRLMDLQLNVRWSTPSATAAPEARFYHKPVWEIFASPIFKLFFEKEPGLSKKVDVIKNSASYYIPQSELTGSAVLETIFRPVLGKSAADASAKKGASSSVPDPEVIRHFAEYLKEIILYVGPVMSEKEPLAFETSFAKAAHNAINQLVSNPLPIKPATFSRMVDRIVSGISIPFEGEPLKGLQVMGPLESRCLDFDNLIVLSCNEGVFPRKSVSSSFIPAELRVGFGLPSYDHQDEMWAYYFYRMIARAKEVWLLYDNRTEGLKKGEESRFIKQLRYHLGADITDWTEHIDAKLLAETADKTEEDKVEADRGNDDEVVKSAEDLAAIKELVLSASSLETYVACPMKFYFSKILGLEAPAEVSEYLDGSSLGTIFHSTMEALYTSDDAMKPGGVIPKPTVPHEITSGYLKDWLNRKEEIRQKVKSLICEELKVPEVTGRNLVMADVICQYVVNTLNADVAYLEEKQASCFRILSLEHYFCMDFLDVKISGLIDRVDQVEGGPVRVVDYKTGSDNPDCLGLTEEKVDLPFTDYRNKAAIQFFLYDEAALHASSQKGGELFPSSREQLVNTMYVPFRLSGKSVPVDYDIRLSFADAMKKKLQDIIADLQDPAKPFVRTEDENTCQFCDFKSICGR